MEAEENKKIDRFLKRIVSEAGTEETSKEFTDDVMRKIGVQMNRKHHYTPLISKMTWRVIAVVVAVVCAVLLAGRWETITLSDHIPYLNQLTELNLTERYSLINLGIKDNIQVHNTVLYTLLMLSFFMYVQILLLRRKFR